MDEFDEIIHDLDNARTIKSLKYLEKRAKNFARNFYDPSYDGVRSKMVKKFKRTMSAIKAKMRQIA